MTEEQKQGFMQMVSNAIDAGDTVQIKKPGPEVIEESSALDVNRTVEVEVQALMQIDSILTTLILHVYEQASRQLVQHDFVQETVQPMLIVREVLYHCVNHNGDRWPWDNLNTEYHRMANSIYPRGRATWSSDLPGTNDDVGRIRD